MCTRHSSSFSLIATLLLSLGVLVTSGCALDAEGTAAVGAEAPATAPADDSQVDESASWAAGNTDPNSARAIDDSTKVLNRGPASPADNGAAQAIEDPTVPVAAREDGDSCAADWECASDFCDGGICAEPSEAN